MTIKAGSMYDKRLKKQREMRKKHMLTGGQAKIAAKAPPPNKIDEKDFAVLRAEKAKGRGMGLQDEKVQPGKVMKARDGKSIKADPTKTITDKGQFVKRRMKLAGSKLPGRIGTALGIGAMMVPAAYAAAKQYKDYKSAKNRDKAKVKKMGGGMIKARVGKSIKTGKISDMSFDEKMKRVESGQINKKTGKFTSMNAMRDAKGFQKGESATDFNKRRMKLERAAKVLKSTRVGKILLPVVGAAVAAKTYLNSKMKKNKDGTPKKKMSGGMMQKPIGYKSGMGPEGAASPSPGRPSGRRPMQKGPKGGVGSLPKKRDSISIIVMTKDGPKRITRSELDGMSGIEQKMGGGMMKKYSSGGVSSKEVYTNARANVDAKGKKNMTINDLKEARKETYATKKMGGGMIAPSQRPGYSKGTMVKARGCKLGRTRPTKIT